LPFEIKVITMTEIETERLALRQFRATDAVRLVEIANHAEISHMLGSMPFPYRLTNAHEFLDSVAELPDGASQFAITLKDKNRTLIGSVGYGPPSAEGKSPDDTDFGYWLGIDYWGNGYASEAAAAVVAHAFIEGGVNAIDTEYLTVNPRSARVLAKLGFVSIGERTCHSRGSGQRKPSIHVRLTRDKFLSRKEAAQ
jgi:RimJ/RimL family protein N-acetyltransferase